MRQIAFPVYRQALIIYHGIGRGCRLVAVPAFKAVREAVVPSPVGSIPTPSVFLFLSHFKQYPSYTASTISHVDNSNKNCILT